ARKARAHAALTAPPPPIGPSVPVEGEVHVVLRRAGPGAAPTPADRAEGRNDRRRHHPLAESRAVEVTPRVRVARHAAADVRVLARVDVDCKAVRMVRPR